MFISPLDFIYDTSVVSKKQFEEHMKLYKGYIDKTNEITEHLAVASGEKANAVYSEYRGLKKGETFALDGVILHEEYFRNISGNSSSIGRETEKVFSKYYSGYDNWQKNFIASAKCARGWCVFVYEQRSKSFRNLIQDAHDEGIISLSYPIIVLDMYEHAYFTDFGTDKNAYIDKFINGINWNVVEKRVNKLSKIIE